MMFQNDMPDFVDKFYRMNPETEDLITQSTGLREGMRVLIESSDKRQDTTSLNEDWKVSRALENNLWCVVSEIHRYATNTWFTATYDDGSKIRRGSFHHNAAWLVKLDSIPPHITESGKYEAVFAAVKQAMDWETDLAYEDIEQFKKLTCDKAARRVFVIFEQEA
jgi:hypothetical protein